MPEEIFRYRGASGPRPGAAPDTRDAMLAELLEVATVPAYREAIADAREALALLRDLHIAAAIGGRIVHLRPVSGEVYASISRLNRGVRNEPLDLEAATAAINRDREQYIGDMTSDEAYSVVVGERARG